MKITATGRAADFPEGEKTVALLMSGGVDSSVAALLLKRDGWNVVGITMRIPDGRGNIAETGDAAARVAAELGIPHFVVGLEEAFVHMVVDVFRREYRAGRTPNPCADCNRDIKFGLLVDAVDELAGRPMPVATGHYARILRSGGDAWLARGLNEARDQSYFLCGLRCDRLARIFFPLGAVSKEEVRALASDAGMAVAERADSMEACFLRGEDYRLAERARPGDIVDRNGTVLGRHDGIFRYTIGQRKGLGIASPEPLYVLGLNTKRNEVLVGGRAEAYVGEVRARRPNLLASDRLDRPLYGKTRSRSPLVPCRMLNLDEEELRVSFDVPQFAPAPGQRLVLYDGEGVVVVSGVIAQFSGGSGADRDSAPLEGECI